MAACVFDGAARAAVHDLKYRRIRSRSEILAELLADAVERRPIALDLLMPVPLAAGRRRERGFNQSEEIATWLGGHIGVPVDAEALRRIRETPPQVGRSGAARRENVAGAFACAPPEAASGKRIGLVDDVMTTGATLEACADALKSCGAARVYALVVTRATS